MTLVDRISRADEPATAEDASSSRLPALRAAGIVGLGLVAVLVLAITVGGGRSSSATPGLPGPGPLVDWGLAVATLAGRVAALGTVGTLLFAAGLLPGPGGVLPAASRRAVQAASRWALAWAATTALTALLTLSQLVGVTSALTPTSLRIFVTDVAAGRSALVVVAAAGVIALVAPRCTMAGASGLLLAAALSGLVVPAVLTGHSAAADNHLLAVSNLSLHVVAAAVWVGGLLALLLHGRGPESMAPAAVRFSAVAFVCFVATGISGLLAAWLVLGGAGALAAVLGTGYGWLLACKTVALVALGIFGWHHRRRTLPALLGAGGLRGFRRFAAVEAGIMLATIALAVALSSSPPPAAASAQPGAQSALTAPPAASGPGLEDMTGHDHGELSVTVLVDETRFHVSAPVDPGSRVTVHNRSTTEVTITAADGSFDVDVPGRSLITFAAPVAPGTYLFASRHSPSFTGVLVVRR